jgi:hypothetical protein
MNTATALPTALCPVCSAPLVTGEWQYELLGRTRHAAYLKCSRFARGCKVTGLSPDTFGVSAEPERGKCRLSLRNPPPPLTEPRRRLAESGLSIVDRFVRVKLSGAQRAFFGGLDEALSLGHTLAVLIAASGLEECNFRRYLVTALKFYFFYGRKNRFGLLPLPLPTVRAEEQHEPVDCHEATEQLVADDLAEVLGRRLTTRHREVFRLMLAGMNGPQIAAEIGVNQSRAAVLVDKVRSKLAEIMGVRYERQSRC